MAILEDLDNLPDLTEETMHPAEEQLIRDWAAYQPSIVKQIEQEGIESLAMEARRALANARNLGLAARVRGASEAEELSIVQAALHGHEID